MLRPTLSQPELITLLLLGDQPRCGYELIKETRLAQAFGRNQLSSSSVYHLLKGLAARGLLVRREETSANAPVRQVYRLSRNGQVMLQRQVGREMGGLRQELELLVQTYRQQKNALLLVESLLR